MTEQHTTPARRVALVTGGSRGIGRESAERLAADGFAVVINYAGNRTEAEAAVAHVVAAGGEAFAHQADVADEVAVAALFDAAEETFGGVDVVVHAAGVMALSPLADLDLDELDRMYRTNIRGTFAVDQQAARRLRAGWSDHQLLDLGAGAGHTRIHRLRRHQGGRRGDDADPRP